VAYHHPDFTSRSLSATFPAVIISDTLVNRQTGRLGRTVGLYYDDVHIAHCDGDCLSVCSPSLHVTSAGLPVTFMIIHIRVDSLHLVGVNMDDEYSCNKCCV